MNGDCKKHKFRSRFPNFFLSHLTQKQPRDPHFPLQNLHHGEENLHPQLVGQVGQAGLLLPGLSPQTHRQFDIHQTNHQDPRRHVAAELLVEEECPIQCWGNQEDKSTYHWRFDKALVLGKALAAAHVREGTLPPLTQKQGQSPLGLG